MIIKIGICATNAKCVMNPFAVALISFDSNLQVQLRKSPNQNTKWHEQLPEKVLKKFEIKTLPLFSVSLTLLTNYNNSLRFKFKKLPCLLETLTNDTCVSVEVLQSSISTCPMPSQTQCPIISFIISWRIMSIEPSLGLKVNYVANVVRFVFNYYHQQGQLSSGEKRIFRCFIGLQLVMTLGSMRANITLSSNSSQPQDIMTLLPPTFPRQAGQLYISDTKISIQCIDIVTHSALCFRFEFVILHFQFL